MTSTSRRTVALTAAALTFAGALCGCAGVGGASDTTPSAPTTGAPSATGRLGFDAGAALDPSWQAQWGDPFIGSTDFTVHTPDDGDGSWAYREEASGCVLGYWQGRLDGFDAAAGDQAASDELLAMQFDADVDEIAVYVGDDISYVSFDGPIAARSVAGADRDAGVTYIVSARAFATIASGLVATLDCPDGVDVYAKWVELAADPGAFTAVVGPLG